MRADPLRHSSLPQDPVEVLVSGGFIDVDFVAAQLGRDPGSAEAAARAVVASTDLAPHPLMDFYWMPRRKVWQRSQLHPVAWYVAERRRRNRLPTNPLIDLRAMALSLSGARIHPYGVMSFWLSLATPDTVLPTRLLADPVTWGEYREAAITAAQNWRSDNPNNRPRLSRPLAPTGELPRVGIVINCQDDAVRIRATITSLQDQKYSNWELIAVDAGSLDDSAAVLAGMAAFDQRITVVRAGRESLGNCLNLGASHTQAGLLAFLTPGRTWPPDQLGRLVAHASSSSADILQAGPGPAARSRAELLTGRAPDLVTCLVRRTAFDDIGGFDEALDGALARDLVLRLTERHMLESVDLGGERRSERVTTQKSGGDDWDSLVLERHLIDWGAAREVERDGSLTSLVLPLGADPRHTIDWFTSAVESDCERIAVGVRLPRAHHLLAGTLAGLLPRSRFLSLNADVNVNVAANLAIAQSLGHTIVVARPDAMPPRQRVTAQLAEAVAQPGIALAQPLVAALDGTTQSAGARFRTSYPNPGFLLAGHPVADAQRAGTSRIAAPASPVVALSAQTAIELRGFNCRFDSAFAETDLGLRAQAAGLGDSLVVPEAIITAREAHTEPQHLLGALASLRHDDLSVPVDNTAEFLGRAGFEITDHRSRRIESSDRTIAGSAMLPEPVVRRIDGIHELPPRLRWAIDIAAPAAARGDRWGDSHFARSLSLALQRHGQDVAVDRRDARFRATRDHDDVLLVLRGLDRVEPHPNLLNLQWIISHPDMVTAEELAGFDLVYAASHSWARRTTQRWGIPVRPLLQCTDRRLFNPDRGEPDTGPELVFVGNSRGVYRFAVRTAHAIGAPLTLHGNDWNEFVSPDQIASNGLANEDVGALYASAGVVLNDHHLDMRRDSFASNRLFDAAACGARIVSDPIEGLAQTFDGLVQTFSNEAELRELIAAPYAAFPDNATRRAVAERFTLEHTFDRRAETLIEDATQLIVARRG